MFYKSTEHVIKFLSEILAIRIKLDAIWWTDDWKTKLHSSSSIPQFWTNAGPTSSKARGEICIIYRVVIVDSNRPIEVKVITLLPLFYTIHYSCWCQFTHTQCPIFYVDRWFSMEYDGFYLESEATNFVFRLSSSATGDTTDSVNNGGSRVNGSPFLTSGQCVTSLGPWWYSAINYCCYSRLFGQNSNTSSGFWWDGVGSSGYLKSARMMIRLINWTKTPMAALISDQQSEQRKQPLNQELETSSVVSSFGVVTVYDNVSFEVTEWQKS